MIKLSQMVFSWPFNLIGLSYIYERPILISHLNLKMFKFWKCAHFMQIRWKCMHFMQIRWKCMHFPENAGKCAHFLRKTLPSRVTFITWFKKDCHHTTVNFWCFLHCCGSHFDNLQYWNDNFMFVTNTEQQPSQPLRLFSQRNWYFCFACRIYSVQLLGWTPSTGLWPIQVRPEPV